MSLLFSVTLYAEFLPAHQRGKCVVLLDVSYILQESFINLFELFACSELLHIIVLSN